MNNETCRFIPDLRFCQFQVGSLSDVSLSSSISYRLHPYMRNCKHFDLNQKAQLEILFVARPSSIYAHHTTYVEARARCRDQPFCHEKSNWCGFVGYYNPPWSTILAATSMDYLLLLTFKRRAILLQLGHKISLPLFDSAECRHIWVNNLPTNICKL